MSNETEREAFEAWCKSIGYCLLKDADGRYKPGYGLELISPFIGGFQAGAAYQREQNKGLVEALELAANRLASLALCFPYVTEQRYAATEWEQEARQTVAAYRSAQEGK